MILEELESEIKIMLYAYKVESKVYRLIKSVSVQFVVEQFGVIVCGINREDYKIITDQVNQDFPDYRVVYITGSDNMLEKKDDVLWELMKGGYIKWVRMNYPRTFNDSIVRGNLGNKIINQRLKIWNDRPKYRFLIEDNEYAKVNSASFIFSIDPSFFDYMPE